MQNNFCNFPPFTNISNSRSVYFFLILNINQKNLKSKEFKNQSKKVQIKEAFKICYYLSHKK